MAREGYKKIAEFMHDRYEFHAKHAGWDTQEKCKVGFADLPEENRRVMLAVAKDVLTYMEEGKHRADPEADIDTERIACLFCDGTRYVAGVECKMCNADGMVSRAKRIPTPGPAKDEPAQQHGFKVGDVVGCDAGSGAEITAIVGIKCTLLYGDGIKVIRDATDLTPVHRCRKVVSSHDELGGDECTNHYEYFIAQPGNMLEPFKACSEEPYPVGTWVRTPSHTVIVELNSWLLWKWREGAPGYKILEARLPEHIVCKMCGGAYVLPKEESNG